MNFLTLAIVLTGIISLGFFSSQSNGPIWPALWLLSITLPASIFSTYLFTLRRIRNRVIWEQKSIIIRKLSGTGIHLFFVFCVTAIALVFLSPRLVITEPRDIWLLIVCFAVFLVLKYYWIPKLQHQLQPTFRYGWPLLWVALVTAFVMVVLDFIIRPLGLNLNEASTIKERLLTASKFTNHLGSSALASSLKDWASLFFALEIWFIEKTQNAGGILAFISRAAWSLTQYPYYFFAAIWFAAFALPVNEYKRIFANTIQSEQPPDVPLQKIGSISSIVVALFVFALIPLVVQLENALKINPLPRADIMIIEMIDGIPTKPGTREKIEKVVYEYSRDSRKIISQDLEETLTLSFNKMRENVDIYLDWYYSLGAEYVRLFKSASGGLDTHLERKLEQTLGYGNPFYDFEEKLRLTIAIESESADRLRNKLQNIIEENTVEISDKHPVQVSLNTTIDQIFNPSLHNDLSTVEQRFVTGGATGIVSVLVARQVVGRLVARGTLRLAATSLARFGAGRSAATFGGASAGAAGGAVIGSIIPGLGTATGAVVGGIVGGLGIGFGAEYLILKAEEQLQRESHKQSILLSINEIEINLRNELSSLLEPVESP